MTGLGNDRLRESKQASTLTETIRGGAPLLRVGSHGLQGHLEQPRWPDASTVRALGLKKVYERLIDHLSGRLPAPVQLQKLHSCAEEPHENLLYLAAVLS